MSTRGMTENEARSRLEAQASRTQREARADMVLDSSGSIEQLDNQVAVLWEKVQELASAKKSKSGTN